jgi:hypothetical protein
MDKRTREAIATIVSATRDWEDTDEYPTDNKGNVIVEGTILEECDIVQEWLKVSDVRKYHLVGLFVPGWEFKILATETEEEKLGEHPAAGAWMYAIITVDPTGEIKIEPL